MSSISFPEFGFYALPGHVHDPKPIFGEVEAADRLGIGSVWISERQNTKDLGVLSGAAAALTRRMAVVSGLIANLPMRNPLVTAGYASTMMALTDNRFAFGIGRGMNSLADMTGTPHITFKLLEDYIGILRRLWRGEVVNYDGPAGTLRNATLGLKLDVVPPVIMGTIGPKTAYWAGKHCDGVVFNSLWSTRALAESVKLVRQGTRDAGRDPASVKVWTILLTACEVPEEVMLQTIIRRLNTYVLFPVYDKVFEINGWDKEIAIKVRKALVEIDGAPKAGTLGDENTSRQLSDLRKIRALYPEQWLREGCAVGTVAECLPAIQERFDAGADGILFHATAPEHLPPLLEAWRKVRPAGFDRKSIVPGL